MNRLRFAAIRLASLVLAASCWVGLAAVAYLMIGGWLAPPLVRVIGVADFSFEPIVVAVGKGIAFAAHVPAMLSVATVMVSAGRMFNTFARGFLFTEETVRYLRWFSWGAFAATLNGLLIPVYAGLIASLTGSAPSGKISFILKTTDLAFLFFCGVFVVLSWILAEAKRHSDDVKLIF